MTTAAWVMLAATWSVVGFFTIRFFLAILRVPMDHGSERDDAEG